MSQQIPEQNHSARKNLSILVATLASIGTIIAIALIVEIWKYVIRTDALIHQMECAPAVYAVSALVSLALVASIVHLWSVAVLVTDRLKK